jgi:hypothetical protein
MAPRDLNHALSLARAYERRARALDVHQTSTTNKPSRPPQWLSFPIPAQQSTVTVAAPTSTGAQRPFKKLTPVEMAERAQTGTVLQL